MARMSEAEMQGWTKEQAIEHAKKEWYERFRIENDGTLDGYSLEEYANSVVEDIDENGWDEDIHGDIDLAMEAWARDTWDGTPWE